MADIIVLLIWLSLCVMAVISAIAIAFVAQRQTFVPQNYLVIGLFAYGLTCIVLWPVLAGRKLSGYSPEMTAELSQVSNSLWLLRGMNALIMGVLIVGIARRFTLKYKINNLTVRSSLGAGVVVYAITNYLLNNTLGTYPAFSMQPAYASCLLLATVLLTEDRLKQVVRWAQVGLVFLTFVSLILIPIAPDLVLQSEYNHGIFSFRFWGLAAHANVMGPIVAITIILNYCYPLRNLKIDFVIKATLFTALVITQSKTAILALIFAFFGNWLITGSRIKVDGYAINHGWRALMVARSSLRPFLGFSALVIFVGFLTISLMIDSDQYRSSELNVLTNRDIIWEVALNEFYRSPIFGYGSSIFDASFRSAVKIGSAVNAHNQIIQTMASAGIVGLFGFLVYLSILGYWAYRLRRHLNGISQILFLFIGFRSFTEVPYSLHTTVGADILIHALFLAILTVASNPEECDSEKSGIVPKTV